MRFEEAHEQLKGELTAVREEADQLKAQCEEQSKVNEELGSTVESLKKEVSLVTIYLTSYGISHMVF